MIPEAQKDAVINALQETFGVTRFENISVLTGGLSSALVFRMVVLGKPYLLRIITRTDAMGDPTIQYACMQAAEQVNIAPRIWYAGLTDRISITDFIEAKPFNITTARIMLPVLLRQLHSLPAFPLRVNYFDVVDGFIKRFRAAKILPEETTAELFRLYDKISAVYPRDSHDWVSCHNDLKPENVLFDGNKVWLVDWEAAFLNDRYSDLAIVANFVVKNDEDEADYLEGYFDMEVSDYHHARFFLMRQIMHMSYFTLFMLLGSAGKPVDANMDKPDFRTFHDSIWAGNINLDDNNMKVQYAWAHLEQLLYNFGLERFEDSLALVDKYCPL